IAVHVVTLRGLARAAVAAPVMRDNAKAMLCQEQQLAVPGVGVEWPAMREGDDGAAAPVLVVDLGAVLGLDRRHLGISLLCVGDSYFGSSRPHHRRGAERSVQACLGLVDGHLRYSFSSCALHAQGDGRQPGRGGGYGQSGADLAASVTKPLAWL